MRAHFFNPNVIDLFRAELFSLFPFGKAAQALLQKEEHNKVTMQDVMNLLKIAKGTIYHYFKSKEELFEAVVEEIVNQHIDKMQTLVQEAKGTALQKIQTLIQSGRKVSHPSILDQLHKKGNEEMHTRLMVAALMKQAPPYASLIEQGCQEGTFKTDTPLESAEFILSAVQFLTDVGVHPWTDEDLARRAKAFSAIIERQLQASEGSFQFMLHG